MTTDHTASGGHPHALRFRATISALVGIAAAALAIAAIVLANHTGATTATIGPAWSGWTPTSSGSEGVAEIAAHIAPYYRLSTSQQLDVITPITVAQMNAAGTSSGSGLTIAVNSSPSGKAQSLGLLNGKTVAYNVCGLGSKNCELAGQASTVRMLLLRREALELALYTLKYIRGTQNVVVVLPPGHTVSAGGSGASSAPITVAVAFVRSELSPWLAVPLSHTLAQYPPETAQLALWSRTPEAGFVDQITAHALFASQVEAQQVGGKLLVLTQLPAQ
ncbi:hypothetical protein [Conexibacter sp. S30A1]|jgi:hypothetical protein|uniref:hypothetical protein n=1 Tax=Conexibacter sp. S30A1 TaxID=2937800 RepID=UPI00200CCD6D|nr:hypothetical protein [Conexibacter sp. S30A1]